MASRLTCLHGLKMAGTGSTCYLAPEHFQLKFNHQNHSLVLVFDLPPVIVSVRFLPEIIVMCLLVNLFCCQ